MMDTRGPMVTLVPTSICSALLPLKEKKLYCTVSVSVLIAFGNALKKCKFLRLDAAKPVANLFFLPSHKRMKKKKHLMPFSKTNVKVVLRIKLTEP